MELLPWPPTVIDPDTPSAARVYDVHLGGAHNFAADREFAARVTKMMPELPAVLRANRAFLGRAVRFMVHEGITQFLDLGSGIPTVGNVHEIAQRTNPACRVVYVDNDAVAIAHSQRILQSNPQATAVLADLRSPQAVLADPAVTGMLDLSRPVGLLLVAVLHFLPDDAEPAQIVAEYTAALSSGSHLALSHATAGEHEPERVEEAAGLYQARMPGFTLRSRAEVVRFFDGLRLVEPGVSHLSAWRPDERPDPTADPSTLPGYAGVAVIP